jgi:hypothetical protein
MWVDGHRYALTRVLQQYLPEAAIPREAELGRGQSSGKCVMLAREKPA